MTRIVRGDDRLVVVCDRCGREYEAGKAWKGDEKTLQQKGYTPDGWTAEGDAPYNVIGATQTDNLPIVKHEVCPSCSED